MDKMEVKIAGVVIGLASNWEQASDLVYQFHEFESVAETGLPNIQILDIDYENGTLTDASKPNGKVWQLTFSGIKQSPTKIVD